MTRHDYPGKFIVFEGCDGSGKSTQAKMLKKYYDDLKKPALVTKEPTLESRAGKIIKRVLKEEINCAPFVLQGLYFEDRTQHIEDLILPNLKVGVNVISERYSLSSQAFGGIYVNMEDLIRLNRNVIEPDITFILDTSAKECMERIKATRDQTEFFEKIDKLTKVLENYRKLALRFDNIFFINGQKTKDEVFEQILGLLLFPVSGEYFKEEAS